MKRLLLFVLFVLSFPSAQAASTRVYATVTITNTPVNGHYLVVNGDTRTWYNTVTNLATELAATNSIVNSRTNLLLHLAAYPPTGPMTAYYGSGTDTVVLAAPVDTALSVTLATNWGTVAYTTNTVSTSHTLVLPFTVQTNTWRTNMMDYLSAHLSTYATTGLVSGSAIASQLVGITNTQTITGLKTFSGVNIHTNTGWIQFPSGLSVLNTNGIIWTKNAGAGSTNTHYVLTGDGFGWPTIHDSGDGYVTNLPDDLGGVLTLGMANAWFPLLTDSAVINRWAASNQFSGILVTNATILAGTATNFTLQGGNGTYSGTVGVFTNGAWASPTLSNAVNRGSSFQSYNTAALSLQLGPSASAAADYAIAIGNASAGGGGSISIGNGTTDTATNAIAIGIDTEVVHDNSVAIGWQAQTTGANQIRLGTSTSTVSIPGLVDAPVMTNSTLKGTTDITLDLALQANTHTGVTAGNNAGVILTNSFNRITGPGGVFTINGIAGGRSGRLVTLYNTTAYAMTIANDSGVDPTAANRIYTLTGGDISTTGTGAVTLLYDPSYLRWIVIAVRD